jgi:hypothetical protein
VLGSGTLFTEEYMGAPVIGVRPDDGRELFRRQEGFQDRFRFGREPDGISAAPWDW